MSVNPIPTGYPPVIPYMLCDDVEGVKNFIVDVFGAAITTESKSPDGVIRHAELKIGDSVIMMGGGSEKFPSMTSSTYVYVPDIDAVHAKAISLGSTEIMPPADQFYGDRSSGVRDKWGNVWWIGTHIEDLSPEEMTKREEAYMAEHAA